MTPYDYKTILHRQEDRSCVAEVPVFIDLTPGRAKDSLAGWALTGFPYRLFLS